jgi:catechol-2,3-dioxygenase
MLGRFNSGASLAVKSMEEATKFYGGILGLKVISENEYERVYGSGDTKLQVYVSTFAGSNKATAMYWEVDDVFAEVAELRDKGVSFEHYMDMPGIKLDGDVHVMGDERAAWFKDPDGNILCIHNKA